MGSGMCRGRLQSFCRYIGICEAYTVFLDFGAARAALHSCPNLFQVIVAALHLLVSPSFTCVGGSVSVLRMGCRLAGPGRYCEVSTVGSGAVVARPSTSPN